MLLTLEKACRSHTDRERAEARLRGDGEATRGRGGQGRRRRSRAEQRPTAPGDVCIEGLAVPRTGRRLRNEPGAGEAGSGEAVCGGLTAVQAEGSTERAKGPLGNRLAPPGQQSAARPGLRLPQELTPRSTSFLQIHVLKFIRVDSPMLTDSPRFQDIPITGSYSARQHLFVL